MMGSIKKNRIIALFKLLLILFVNIAVSINAQEVIPQADTLHLKAGSRIEFLNSVEYIANDTVIIIPANSKYIICEARDSTTNNFYNSLQNYSKKNKLLKLLHNSIIIDNPSAVEGNDNAVFSKSFVEYHSFSGKIISGIYFKQVRLFSGAVTDTTNLINRKKQGLFERVHYDTKTKVIEKFLTFHTGDTLKAQDISDSERILRQQSFIEDAKIMLVTLAGDSNMVDVIVTTKDRFSLGINLNPHSLKRISTTLYDRNVLGYGWNFEVEHTYNADFDIPNGIKTKMNFINMYGSFIDAEIGYRFNEEREGGRLSLSKPFVTVETKYGGGINFETLHSFVNYGDTLHVSYTDDYGDIWISRQFPISQADRNKTMFVAGRIARKDFTNRPQVFPDSNYFFYDEYLVLGSLIYSKIDYYKSRLIYGFGITEDIPVGTRIGITAGVLYDDFNDYNYLGFKFGHSIIGAKFGYLLFGVKYGGLYDKYRFKHGSLYIYSNYISPLIRHRKFNFRHFFHISYAEIYNRERNYYLHFGKHNDIRGLNLNQLRGDKRLAISYEGLMFMPFNFYGFRFVMYDFVDFGAITNNSNSLFNNKLYSGFGLGWRIKNESLVFATIQIRFAYYPNTVDGGGSFGFDVKTSNKRLFNNVFPVKPEILYIR